MNPVYEIQLKPADTLAAMVTQKPPADCRFEVRPCAHQLVHAERIKAALQQRRQQPAHNAKNYFGQQRGLVTVSFYAGFRRVPDRDIVHYWLVRCQCGEYEIRSHVALRKHREFDACDKCKHNDYLRFKATGRNYLIEAKAEIEKAESRNLERQNYEKPN